MEEDFVAEQGKTSISKCTNCGADMVFSPKRGSLVCPFCDTEKAIKVATPSFRDFFSSASGGYVETGKAGYRCPNCDGLVKVEGFSTSMTCPYCGATNVINLSEFKGLKPDGLLPFTVSQEEAIECGRKWIKKKIFAPSKAKKMFSPNEMNGLYVPSFIFNSDTTSKYEGRFGEEYQVEVKKGDQIVTETRVRWYHVSGTWNRDFRDIVVEACSKTTQRQMNGILPYDLQNAVNYDKAFLAGFSSERYDTSITDSCNTAKDSMQQTIRNEIIRHHNPDRVDYLNVTTTYKKIEYEYLLLPVWQSEYPYKKKIYNFMVNGRTGKSTGKAPVSPLRILFLVLGVVAVVGAIVGAIIYSYITSGGY